jgi:hypothetical protein
VLVCENQNNEINSNIMKVKHTGLMFNYMYVVLMYGLVNMCVVTMATADLLIL